MASAGNLCGSLALTEADCALNMMPLFHIGGLVDLLLAPLSVGASSICTANFSPPGFVKCLEAFEPTFYQGVPTMLQEILADEAVRQAVRASSLRFARSVSAALPEQVRVDFERELGIPIVEIYGMTEASGLIASNPIPPAARKAGSVGIAAGTEIRILSDSLEPVAALERGEVVIRGASVITAYESPAEANADAFVDTWMRTGDQGYLDEDGFLFLTGRIKEIINRGGEKISPREVDELLASHPAVAEAATFAMPHRALGEDVAVTIVLNPGATLSQQEVVEFLRPRLAYFKIPRSVYFLAEIPRTPGGKLKRTELPVRLKELGMLDAEPSATDQAYEAPESLIGKKLAEMWARVLDVEAVGVNDDFFDLGGDSLKAATFINELQEEWGEIVYVSALFDAPTIATFEAYIHESCPELVIKILGGFVRPEEDDLEGNVDAESLAKFRASIVRLAGSQEPASEKNPRAIFILSTPRSGSTLLRVLLGGNSRLFAPPELFLLPFDNLADRGAWFSRSQPFLREGNLRALIQLSGQGLEEVERAMAEFEEKNLSTQTYYRMLQDRLGERVLVDKTPFNATHVETLRRAEQYFQDPVYVHLVRHPYAMIRSFEEAKLDQLWHPRLVRPEAATGASGVPRRDFAEMIWVILQENIREFLRDVPSERQVQVKFEDLVGNPEQTMKRLCSALSLAFEPAMLAPHADPRERMTDGLHPDSRMIGDMKFHQHDAIDASAADIWKEHHRSDFLSGEGRALAAELGYDEMSAETPDREEFVI